MKATLQGLLVAAPIAVLSVAGVASEVPFPIQGEEAKEDWTFETLEAGQSMSVYDAGFERVSLRVCGGSKHAWTLSYSLAHEAGADTKSIAGPEEGACVTLPEANSISAVNTNLNPSFSVRFAWRVVGPF